MRQPAAAFQKWTISVMRFFIGKMEKERLKVVKLKYSRRQATILILAISLVLSLLSALFVCQVSEMLRLSVQDELLFATQAQADVFSDKTDSIFKVLKASTPRLLAADGDARRAIMEEMEPLAAFSELAVATQGDALFSKQPQLARALEEGKAVYYSELLPHGGEGLIFAIAAGAAYPGMVVYGALPRAVAQRTLLLPLEDQGRAFLMDENGELRLSMGSTDASLAMQKHMEQWDGNADAQVTVQNEFYLVRLSPTLEGWTWVGLWPRTAADGRAALILRLLIGVLAAFILMLLAAFLYLDHHSRTHQKTVYRLAYRDGLTGAPNWDSLVEYLDHMEEKDYALALFDIKHFKIINDLFGYEYGDNLLCTVVHTLPQYCAAPNAFARLDNDHFCIVLTDDSDEALTTLLTEMFRAINDFANVDANTVGYSCGVARFNRDTKGGWKALLDCAKIARETVKKNSATSIAVFNRQMKQAQVLTQRLRHDLSDAVANGDLRVYFQPKIDLRANRIVGAEALIRWQHHTMGMLAPDVFVPVFEREGAIKEMDAFVLNSVCTYLRDWKEQGLLQLPVSVNLSRAQINERNLVRNLAQTIAPYRLDPSLLDFELTETSAIGSISRISEVVGEMKERGFRVSLDDFGTGYSSLQLLRDVTIDTMKVDRSLINGVTQEGRNCTFLRDIILMAKHLGIQTLGEGIETEEQHRAALDVGCDIGQGYYYSRPISHEAYEELLREQMQKDEDEKRAKV